MQLSLRIDLGVGDQRPRHPDHAVEASRELVRLRDDLEGAAESLHQGGQD